MSTAKATMHLAANYTLDAPAAIRQQHRKRGVFGVINASSGSAIELVIGHLKADGHLGRRHLKGREGDAANVVLTAIGHNLVLAWLAIILRLILIAPWRLLAVQTVLQSAY
jgi:IS5 family transposase